MIHERDLKTQLQQIIQQQGRDRHNTCQHTTHHKHAVDARSPRYN
uniref:Uncharacterized protein n=1 Tax=Arundo donax TaxID=35708 RepID=A0A0A9HBS6_ARUDO